MSEVRRRESQSFQSASSMTRADFLRDMRRRLDGASGGTALPETPEVEARRVHDGEDLSACFKVAAENVGMRVHGAAIANWLAVVGALLSEQGQRTLAVSPAGDGFITAERYCQIIRMLESRGVRATGQFDDETMFSVDAALTGAAWVVAESGSLVCESGGVPRGLSLIPPVHIAVVGASQLLPDLCDLFARYKGGIDLPAGISLITGPSKTADIEGVLVKGVHGPRAVHIVLIADA